MYLKVCNVQSCTIPPPPHTHTHTPLGLLCCSSYIIIHFMSTKDSSLISTHPHPTHPNPPTHTHTHTHTFHPSQNELRESTQVVTEEEREHVMSGNFDQLLAEQERMDRERDNEVQWRLFILSIHACTHVIEEALTCTLASS